MLRIAMLESFYEGLPESHSHKYSVFLQRLVNNYSYPRKFYIIRNNNKVDFIETGRIVTAHLFA